MLHSTTLSRVEQAPTLIPACVIPGDGQGCVAQPPGRSGRHGKGSLKAAAAAAGSGEQRGAGTGRRRGPPGRAWGSGSGRRSPLLSYVCQGAADAAARDKVKGERRDGGQTRQPPRWEAATNSIGRANPARARNQGGSNGGPGSLARRGQRGRRRRQPPASLSQQPRSARFHPPPLPIPPPLRPPLRPSASRSPSAAGLGFRDKVGGGGKGGEVGGGGSASICLSTEG